MTRLILHDFFTCESLSFNVVFVRVFEAILYLFICVCRVCRHVFYNRLWQRVVSHAIWNVTHTCLQRSFFSCWSTGVLAWCSSRVACVMFVRAFWLVKNTVFQCSIRPCFSSYIIFVSLHTCLLRVFFTYTYLHVHKLNVLDFRNHGPIVDYNIAYTHAF
jgi:hypothetical protein